MPLFFSLRSTQTGIAHLLNKVLETSLKSPNTKFAISLVILRFLSVPSIVVDMGMFYTVNVLQKKKQARKIALFYTGKSLITFHSAKDRHSFNTSEISEHGLGLFTGQSSSLFSPEHKLVCFHHSLPL